MRTKIANLDTAALDADRRGADGDRSSRYTPLNADRRPARRHRASDRLPDLRDPAFPRLGGRPPALFQGAPAVPEPGPASTITCGSSTAAPSPLYERSPAACRSGTHRIRKLGKAAWKAIRVECAGRVGSVLELLQGRLSDHVLRVVTDPARGLFPKPGEITLTCDCPDWAVMCKHAAAVLYGVGSRLDDRPELLFRLRDVDAEDLVVGDMALPDASAGDDVLAGDLADIFGIDLDPADSGAAAARPGTTGRRRPRRGRPRRTGAPASGFQPTARRVAELRHQGGFSVPEFAGLLRVSASTVYRWEAARGPLALRAGQEDALQVLYPAIEKRQT